MSKREVFDCDRCGNPLCSERGMIRTEVPNLQQGKDKVAADLCYRCCLTEILHYCGTSSVYDLFVKLGCYQENIVHWLQWRDRIKDIREDRDS